PAGLTGCGPHGLRLVAGFHLLDDHQRSTTVLREIGHQVGLTSDRGPLRRVEDRLWLTGVIACQRHARLQPATVVVPAVLLPERLSGRWIAVAVLDVLRAGRALDLRIRIPVR